MRSGRCVAVIGPGTGARIQDLEVARAVGRLLAEADVTVVCGGLGGVMEAVAAGAADAGGRTMGILPGSERNAANPHVTVAIPTGLGELRNALVIRAASAVIAVGGSWGTLIELAMARRAGLPVVSVGGWTLRDSTGLEVPSEAAPSAELAVGRVLELIRGS
ncbi:MAG: TIGR00725 family protein [Candidatus Dormibacteria bacterium]